MTNLQQPENQEVQNEQEKQSKELNLVKSLNETYSLNNLSLFENIIKTGKGLILLVEVILLGFFLYNYKLGTDLKKIDDKIDAVKKQVLLKQEKESEIYKNYEKYSSYKKLSTATAKTEEKISLIYTSTPAEVVIVGLTLKDGVLELILRTNNATDFAKLVVSYLESKKVDSVILKGATYTPKTNTFDFDVFVNVKKSI